MKTPARRDDSFLEFVQDQLDGLGDIHVRRMFGAHGVYCDGVFIAIVHQGRVYFKTDDESRKAHEDAGMEPFQPTKKIALTSYYEVPVDVLEDAGELKTWARRAVRAQQAAPQKKKRRSRSKGQ